MSQHLQQQYCICHFESERLLIKTGPVTAGYNALSTKTGPPDRCTGVGPRLDETKKRQFPCVRTEEVVKLDAPWYSPSGKCSKKKEKKKNEGGDTQFGLSRMTLDSMRKYSCISEG